MAVRTLTDLERRILAFEQKWEGRQGSKAAASRQEFGWSLAAYEQRLQTLLKEPAAEAAEPQLVHRALRVRELRSQRRASRSFDPIVSAG